MNHVANFIQDLLRQRGVSLRRLAMEAGISPSTLSRWVSGKQTPSPQACQKLSEALSLPVERLLVMSGHLVPMQKADADALPEFREYARQKYPAELDDDMVGMIEDLIQRRRRKLNEGGKNT